jgi:hypothetical protein
MKMFPLICGFDLPGCVLFSYRIAEEKVQAWLKTTQYLALAIWLEFTRIFGNADSGRAR